MSFTTQCFIRKNTPELRNKLEELGYEPYCIDIDENSLYVSEKQSGWLYFSTYIQFCNDPRIIDCGTNDPLFLALAALRDDSDYMQCFTDGENFCSCDETFFDFHCTCNQKDVWHKCTIQELAEHFKTKNST